MTKSTTAHLTIDLDDVRRAGSVEAAIETWCEESDDTSCGVVGPSFSTSGPGQGWSINHDENDFASRAFEQGAMHYVDATDGRCKSVESAEDAERDEDGNLPDDICRDISGCLYRETDWSGGSVVRLECPSIEDALERPAEVAEMAKAVIRHHSAESDVREWKSLIEAIRAAAEAFDGIDLDELDA